MKHLPMLLLLLLLIVSSTAQFEESEEASFIASIFPHSATTKPLAGVWIPEAPSLELAAQIAELKETLKAKRANLKFADEVGAAASVSKRPMTEKETEILVRLNSKWSKWSKLADSKQQSSGMILYLTCIYRLSARLRKGVSLKENHRHCLENTFGMCEVNIRNMQGRAQGMAQGRAGHLCQQRRTYVFKVASAYEALLRELQTQFAKLLAPPAVAMREMAALAPGFFVESLQDGFKSLLRDLRPQTRLLVYSKQPNMAYIAPLILGAILTFISGAGLIVGIWTGFWRMNDLFKLVMGVLVFAGSALLMTHALFCIMGYQMIGYDSAVLNVSETTVFLIQRLAKLAMLSLLAVFSIVLIEAAAETLLEKEIRWPRYVMVAITVVCLLYGVSMAVVSAVYLNVFLVDATLMVLISAQLLFTGTLLTAFFLIVKRFWQTDGGGGSAEAKRNANVFFGFSAVLFGLTAAQVVVGFLWFFRYVSLTLVVTVMAYVFEVLLLGGALVYLGANLRGSWIRKRTLNALAKSSNNDGYVPLTNEGGSIPPQYEA